MNRKTRRGILKSDFGNNICPLLNKHKPRDPGRIDLLVTLAIQHFRSRQVVGGKKTQPDSHQRAQPLWTVICIKLFTFAGLV